MRKVVMAMRWVRERVTGVHGECEMREKGE